MLTLRDHRSGDLFDPWEHLGLKRRRLLDRSWAGVFREHLLRHLPVRELAPHFADSFGRPTKDLHVALGVLILQQLHDLTDEQTVEALSFNIAWHYALDIRNDTDAYICERTLRNYRGKVIQLKLDQLLFRSLTDRLIQGIGVDTNKQRLDSTAVRSAIRSLTRLGILVEATSKYLRDLRRRCPDLYGAVDETLIRKYVVRQGGGCFADTRPSESKRRLPEAARDIHELLHQFRATEARDLESFRLLEQVFQEQCEVTNDATDPVAVKDPQDIPCDSVLNPADPDASYNRHRGAGYLVQIMETFAEDDSSTESDDSSSPPDLITHVAVGKMTVHDQDALVPAIQDAAKRDVKPEELLADSHYGSNESIAKGKELGVEVVSPSMPAKGKQQGKLTLEDFELDEKGRVLRCPGGQAPVETSVADIRLQVLFNASACAACPHRDRCPMSAAGRKQRRYQYSHDRVRQRRRRLEDASDGFRHRYRWRAGVEATMSRFKHQMGMAKLRIRGMAKVTYVAMLRALGLNILRVAVSQTAK